METITSNYDISSAYNYPSAEDLDLSTTGIYSKGSESMLETNNNTTEEIKKSGYETGSGPISKLISSTNTDKTVEETTVETSTTESLETKTESLKEFDTLMKQVMTPDAQGNVHEEQMQFVIAHFLLAKKDTALGSQYLEIFNSYIGSGTPLMSAEDAVKATLKSLVEKGKISEADAETINGISFRAAQLDDNLATLYDNRGSASDTTISVMKKEEAIKKALATMEEIEAGTVTVESRSLDAPSNTAPNTFSGVSGAARSSGGSGGFLWKPTSESDGKLAVLLPSSISDSAVSAEIHSELPPTSDNLVESGKNTNRFHEGRRIFRFSQEGGSYPDNCYIVAKLSDGSTETYKIPDSSSRVE